MYYTEILTHEMFRSGHTVDLSVKLPWRTGNVKTKYLRLSCSFNFNQSRTTRLITRRKRFRTYHNHGTVTIVPVSCIRSGQTTCSITFLQFKQDRQCTCNVMMRCVHETTVAVVSNKYYIFLCVRARGWVGHAYAWVRPWVWVHERGLVRV